MPAVTFYGRRHKEIAWPGITDEESLKPMDGPIAETANLNSPVLQQIAEISGRRSEVGEVLEALADELPKRQAPIWRQARRLCRDVLDGHLLTMKEALLPVLLKRTQDEPDCQDVLQRFTADYQEEKHRLTDLDDLLCDALATDTYRIDADAMGYALRGFFESISRHSLWETEVLLPLANRKLTQEDQGEITNRLRSFGIIATSQANLIYD